MPEGLKSKRQRKYTEDSLKKAVQLVDLERKREKNKVVK
ncbi:hypothetical protein RvY_11621 [Ramazzottius varieornatus]|uniref:Uncharacterized protein n=1 Tax=Ramazzottius varieornatus TaxID=947166 RepID=A0A1D1VGP6_RAMVA|nr:hypothetical protein RvY_11621 [Ramazzottius varieornatus]